jgi:magnesium transporter
MTEIKFKKSRWINLTDVTPEDILTLKKKYKFHDLDLEDCLSDIQRPKIDEYEKYLFIILQFPNFNKNTQRYDTEQVNIFIGQNFIITLHKGNLELLNDLFENCQKSLRFRRETFNGSTGYLLYKILHKLFSSCFSITDKIQISLKNIEKNLFDSKRIRDQLEEIMITKKNIITLRKVIAPERSVVAALEHKNKKFLPEGLEVYFDDVVDHIEKLWTILETQKEVVESLGDTNESLISHNINHLMRTFTIISVLMVPFSVINNLFSINIRLPFANALENPTHFWRLLVLMFMTSVLTYIFFKWKKWF